MKQKLPFSIKTLMQQNSQNEIYRSIGKKELWRYAKKRKKLILDDLKER